MIFFLLELDRILENNAICIQQLKLSCLYLFDYIQTDTVAFMMHLNDWYINGAAVIAK